MAPNEKQRRLLSVERQKQHDEKRPSTKQSKTKYILIGGREACLNLYKKHTLKVHGEIPGECGMREKFHRAAQPRALRKFTRPCHLQSTRRIEAEPERRIKLCA